MIARIEKKAGGVTWKGRLAVAVVVVVVLIGSVNYVVRNYRDSADQRRCMDNLRQLWSASMMYAQDHDGWMPIYTNNKRTGKIDPRIMIGFPSPEKLRASMDKYVTNDAVWFCRSALSAERYEGYCDHQYSTYKFNFCKPGSLRADGLVQGKVKPQAFSLHGKPEKYPLVHDDGDYHASSLVERPAGPHQGGVMNCIYLDGHIESHEFE